MSHVRQWGVTYVVPPRTGQSLQAVLTYAHTIVVHKASPEQDH